jgi:hypothetical protein
MVYTNGARRLQPVGRGLLPYLNNQTDDHGEARLYGLATGEYYISARGYSELAGAPIGFVDRDRIYVPTYFPGTPAPGEARRVAVEQGREVRVTFPLAVGKPLRIVGVVRTSTGDLPRPVRVELLQTGSLTGNTASAATDPGGAFTIRDVPPGDYVLRTSIAAPYSSSGKAESAALPIRLTTDDVVGIVLATSAGAVLRGHVVYDAPPSYGFRPGSVVFDLVSAGRVAPDPIAQRSDDGRFEFDGLIDGSVIRMRPGVGWYLKAVMLDGRDVTDVPLSIPDGQELNGVEVIATRKSAAVTGTAADGNGPATEYAVVLFPEDRAQWNDTSRFIASARANEQGRFRMSGMPAGKYLVTAVDHLDTGSQFDPELLQRLAERASSLVLGEDETKDVTLKIVD